MTLLSWIFSWLPICLGVIDLATLVFFLCRPTLWSLLMIPCAVYGIPLIGFRLLQTFAPMSEGPSDLRSRHFSSWWAGHQLQALFIGFSWLETPLRLTPGLFSFWLRLWGSKVGRQVYWTPAVEILDRNLLEIGDGVIFGHKVACYGHVVKTKGDRLLLYVRRIRIGQGAFLGAGARLGPGVNVASGSFVPILSDLYPNQSWPTISIESKESSAQISKTLISGKGLQ
jgi:hypothetical protein